MSVRRLVGFLIQVHECHLVVVIKEDPGCSVGRYGVVNSLQNIVIVVAKQQGFLSGILHSIDLDLGGEYGDNELFVQFQLD